MKGWSATICLCLTFLIAFSIYSQPNGYSIDYLTIDNGLPQNEVTSIIQDKKGFIWFGTRGGLARYDGNNVKVFQYEPGKSNGLYNTSVETLFESSDGKIWIGTKSGGVNCFDPIFERFTNYEYNPKDTTSISSNRVVSIAENENGNIWIGTWADGLNLLDPTTGRVKRFLHHRSVLALKKDVLGNLWIGSRNSLYQIQGNGNVPRPVHHLDKSFEITALQIDPEKPQLYLAGWNSCIIKYDIATKKANRILRSNLLPVPQSDNSYSILLESNDRLWVGFWGDGLYLRENETFNKVSIAPHKQGRYNKNFDIILSIFEDRSNNIWIGTDGGGVCKLTRKNNLFTSYTLENSDLISAHILSILEDKSGRVWIGTKGGGLHELRNGKIIPHPELYESIKDRKVNDIHTLYQDKEGVIWIGSNFGMHKISKIVNDRIQFETITREARANSLSDEKVMAILKDSKKNFWVGTQQHGLNRLVSTEGGRPDFKVYMSDPTKANSISDNRISVLFEDSKGNVWVGTYKGLHLYRDDLDGFLKLSQDLKDKNSLSNDIVTSISEDINGNIWVGTARGLNKIILNDDALSATSFTKRNGFVNDYIQAILPDDIGNLWISSNGGLFRFTPADSSIHIFYASDGLQANAFSENSACLSTSGLMYFGGINGFSVFDPRMKLTSSELLPSFVQLKIMNKEVATGEIINGDEQILERSLLYTEEITLGYQDKVLSLEVSSLDYSFPERNQYSFKLSGFDTEWLNTGNNRSVTYTNLKAGTYQLRVKSSDVGNVWVGDPIVLKISVLPPPWQTWWAYLSYAIVILTIGTVVWKFVKGQMRLKAQLQYAQVVSAKAELEKQKEREVSEMKFRFFTNVSHELKTPLTLIISPLEELLLLRDTPRICREKLLVMHRHSARLLTLVQQLLDLRKSENGNLKLALEQGDLVKFIAEVFESFAHLAERRHIAYSFHSDVDQLMVEFDQNKIEMAITNILSNAFKYTPDAGKIRCYITIDKEESTNKLYSNITIEDTGRGMPKEALDKIFDLYYQVAVVDSVKISGTGIGLSLVKEIVQLHHGIVIVDSEQGRGSKFTMKLPLKQLNTSNTGTLNIVMNNEAFAEKNGNALEALESERPIILVIEDTDELRNYLDDLLHDEFQVLTASSGEAGLKLALDKIPDIIVSDVMMEQMDGVELCDKVKHNEKTCHIPVILLTAKIMPESELSGFDAGADDYIKKPFNPTILVARIRRLLDSRKQLKEYYSRKVTLQPTNIEITSYDEKFLQKAMNYIEANLLNPDLSAESLGFELGMSHSTLYRKLKALTGQSINGFMRSIRIKRAAQLLETGEYTVSEVAFQTGFSELKYFRNYFKEQFGCLPSEYVKNPSTLNTD